MSRHDVRRPGGSGSSRNAGAPLRTAAQLRDELTLPTYLVIVGSWVPMYPGSGVGTKGATPAPSAQVLLRGVRPLSATLRAALGDGVVMVARSQWEGILAPLVQDETLRAWAGLVPQQESALVLNQNIYGPDNTVALAEGTQFGTSTSTQTPSGLYKNDLSSLLGILGQRIYLAAGGI